MTAGADEFSDADTHNSHGVYVQPTIKDVLDFCQDVYRKTALFGDAAFVAEFNARVTAIGRVVCAEQGVPFATNNGLSDKTPLGAYAQQLFGELVAWPAEPIDQNTLDEIMSSCDLDDGNDCDDCIDSIDEPMTCRFEFTPINSVDMTDPSFWGPDDVSLDGHWLHRSRHSLPGIGDE